MRDLGHGSRGQVSTPGGAVHPTKLQPAPRMNSRHEPGATTATSPHPCKAPCPCSHTHAHTTHMRSLALPSAPPPHTHTPHTHTHTPDTRPLSTQHTHKRRHALTEQPVFQTHISVSDLRGETRYQDTRRQRWSNPRHGLQRMALTLLPIWPGTTMKAASLGTKATK